MSRKKSRLKKNPSIVDPSDFSSMAAYRAYLNLLQVQRDATATLYDKIEAQKMRDKEEKKRSLAKTKEKLNAIASKPQYRRQEQRNRIKNKFLTPRGVVMGPPYKSVRGGGATKIDSSHNPEEYKYSNKNALRLDRTLAETRKYRELYGKDE